MNVNDASYRFEIQERIRFRASKAPGIVTGRFHFQGVNKYLVRYKIDQGITDDWFEESLLEKR